MGVVQWYLSHRSYDLLIWIPPCGYCGKPCPGVFDSKNSKDTDISFIYMPYFTHVEYMLIPTPSSLDPRR